ncbi:MAG: alpha/beta hydrolase [Acholeplasmatales bacterium]|nr:alpha/beta hydrolase [Acholeplasmatales bacterium]
MRFGVLAINLIMKNVNNDVKRRKKFSPEHGIYDEKLNIPYIDDNNICHTYDVYKAKENRKNCCILNIHGGAYMFGDHRENYYFATEFLKEGFDVVLLDYEPNDGNKNTIDLIKDLELNFKHLFDRLNEYGLENDKFVLAGDSAGGHFALLFSEALINHDIQRRIGITLPDIMPICTLVSCPVYDFGNVCNLNMLTKGGMKRMFGPNYSDKSSFELISPKTYYKDLRLPIFHSTCYNDFIRFESLKLKEDMKKRDDYEYVEITEKAKGVTHVHNVIYPFLKSSKYINDKMIEFILKNL